MAYRINKIFLVFESTASVNMLFVCIICMFEYPLCTLNVYISHGISKRFAIANKMTEIFKYVLCIMYDKHQNVIVYCFVVWIRRMHFQVVFNNKQYKQSQTNRHTAYTASNERGGQAILKC